MFFILGWLEILLPVLAVYGSNTGQVQIEISDICLLLSYTSYCFKNKYVFIGFLTETQVLYSILVWNFITSFKQ